MATATANGSVCLITLLALAVGICVATVLFRLIAPVKLRFYKKNKFAEMRRAAKYANKQTDNEQKKHSNKKDG